MDIKAKRLAPEPVEPDDVFDGDIERCLEEAPPPQFPKERKTSNIVLAFLGLFLFAFIVTMIVIFCVKGSVPDTLIQYTMGAGGVEALVLAGIKVSKVLAGDKPGLDPPDGMG